MDILKVNQQIKFNLVKAPASVVIKCGGGFGDVLICVGSLAKLLRKKGYVVHASVLSKHMEMAASLEGVESTFDILKFRYLSNLSGFDCYVDVTQALVENSRQLVNKDFYEAAANHLGFEFEEISSFKSFNSEKKNRVAIHPSSSNPVRKWRNENWYRLATLFMEKGYEVLWLGTPIDYGLRGSGMLVACDTSESIFGQIKLLSECKYFVGNDSGFLHAAGILGIEGVGLFGATNGDHSAGKYKSIKAINAYERFGKKPSRTLRNDDKFSRGMLESVKAEEVIEVLNPTEIKGRHARKPRLLFNTRWGLRINGSYKYEQELYKWFDKGNDIEINVGFFSKAGGVTVYKDEPPERVRRKVRKSAGEFWPRNVRRGQIIVSRKPGLGDVILSTSVLAVAKEQFPEASLIFETKPQYEFLIPTDSRTKVTSDKDHPHDLKVVLDYYECWRYSKSALHFMGGNEYELNINKSQIVAEEAPKTVGIWVRQGENPNKIKEWSDENWIVLAKLFYSIGYKVFQIGTTSDTLIDSIYIEDGRKRQVEEAIRSVEKFETVVTIEGAAQHYARAVNKKVYVLWGKSSSPEIMGYSFHSNIVSSSKEECFASVDPSTFKEGNCCGGDCMDMKPEEVFLRVLKGIQNLE